MSTLNRTLEEGCYYEIRYTAYKNTYICKAISPYMVQVLFKNGKPHDVRGGIKKCDYIRKITKDVALGIKSNRVGAASLDREY